MIPQRWLIVSGAMCSGALLWSAVLIGALLAGVRLLPTTAAVGVAAVLAVPGVIAGVIGNRWYYRTTRPRRPWRLASWVPPHVPHWAAVTAGLAFFGFWLAVVLAFAALDGNPAMRDGRYVLEDHDRVIEVNQQVWDRQTGRQQRRRTRGSFARLAAPRVTQRFGATSARAFPSRACLRAFLPAENLPPPWAAATIGSMQSRTCLTSRYTTFILTTTAALIWIYLSVSAYSATTPFPVKS